MCHNLSKQKEMEMGLKILSVKNGNNIDSTDNVKRGPKAIKSQKVGKGRHFFQIYHMRVVKKFHFLSDGGQEFLPRSQRGVQKFLSRHFEFDHPPNTGL